jgi:broad specificity phosphatase PhoE
MFDVGIDMFVVRHGTTTWNAEHAYTDKYKHATCAIMF